MQPPQSKHPRVCLVCYKSHQGAFGVGKYCSLVCSKRAGSLYRWHGGLQTPPSTPVTPGPVGKRRQPKNQSAKPKRVPQVPRLKTRSMVPSAANGVKRTVLGDANTDGIPSEALDGDLQSMLRMDTGYQIASRQPAIGAGRESLRRNGLSRSLLAWNAVAEKRKRVTRLAASDKLNASTLSAQPLFRSVTGEAALENTSPTERERKRARMLTSGEPHGPTLNAKSEICSVAGEIADPSTPTMDSIEMESRLTTADILYVPAQESQPVLSSVLGAAADEKTAVVESEGKKLSLAPVDLVDAVLTPTPLREFCLATGAATDEIATPVSFLVLRDEWTRLLRRRSRKVAKAAQAAYRSPERRPLSPINLSWLATIANGNETGNVELADLDGRVASFSAAEFTSPCRDLWAAAEAVDALTAPEQEDFLYVKGV